MACHEQRVEPRVASLDRIIRRQAPLETVGKRPPPGRVDNHQIGFTARVEVADAVFQVERPCAGDGCQVEHFRRVQGCAGPARFADMHFISGVQYPGDKPTVPTGNVAANGDVDAGFDRATPRHGSAAQELLTDGAMGDGRLRFCHSFQLSIGTMHAMGQDSASAKQAFAPLPAAGKETAIIGVKIAVNLISF